MSCLVGVFLPTTVTGTIADLGLTFQTLAYEKHRHVLIVMSRTDLYKYLGV